MSDDKQFRVVAAVTTQLVREACRRHDVSGPEAIVLGRALTAGCLLATLTKDDRERIRIQMDGAGPVGQILVDAQGAGIRGCLQRRPDETPSVTMVAGRPSVGALVGRRGSLIVTRDLGLEQQYQGTVAITSGEIDTDLERYLNRSEQLPSVLACEVRLGGHNQVLRTAGILCQTVPNAPAEALAPVRGRVHAGGLFDVLTQDRSPGELIGFVLGGVAFSAAEDTPLTFECSCGPKRALIVLSSLGANDLEELAGEPGPTEVRCNFCGAAYEVETPQLRRLAQTIRKQRS